mmetsp:Transcript_169998/g.413257  ORF Transcript_169998/g.413257 Transcript_169998/m.413257 type:complete len:210 (+) Transcript_169998:3825-4454(+)
MYVTLCDSTAGPTGVTQLIGIVCRVAPPAVSSSGAEGGTSLSITSSISTLSSSWSPDASHGPSPALLTARMLMRRMAVPESMGPTTGSPVPSPRVNRSVKPPVLITWRSPSAPVNAISYVVNGAPPSSSGWPQWSVNEAAVIPATSTMLHGPGDEMVRTDSTLRASSDSPITLHATMRMFVTVIPGSRGSEIGFPAPPPIENAGVSSKV